MLIVLTTAPSAKDADTIATALLEKHLAACVNIVPGVTSKYWWQGALETSEEFLLVIKTGADCYAELEAAIRAVHPYQTPEVVAIRPDAVFDPYLKWVLAECLNR